MLKIKPNARRLLGLLLLTGFVTSCSFESVRQLSGTTKLTPFEEIKIIGGENTVWGERYHPFIGATSIDIDGDGMMEIYVSAETALTICCIAIGIMLWSISLTVRGWRMTKSHTGRIP